MNDGEMEMPERRCRRLSDHIMASFNEACGLNDVEVAAELLKMAETVVSRGDRYNDGRYEDEVMALVAAHERLRGLRPSNIE